MLDKVCPSCGTRLSDYYNTGYLGCPDCYKAFEKEILVSLKKIQGKTFHVGKKPKADSIDKELLKEYRLLLSAKETAGLEGRFADMAKINRKLIEIQNVLKERGVI